MKIGELTVWRIHVCKDTNIWTSNFFHKIEYVPFHSIILACLFVNKTHLKIRNLKNLCNIKINLTSVLHLLYDCQNPFTLNYIAILIRISKFVRFEIIPKNHFKPLHPYSLSKTERCFKNVFNSIEHRSLSNTVQ